MVGLPAQSSYLPQSERTTMGDDDRKGVARPIAIKTSSAMIESRMSSDQAIPGARRKTLGPGIFDFIEYSSETDDSFNPTVKNSVPDRFQKARMKKEAAEAQKDKEFRYLLGIPEDKQTIVPRVQQDKSSKTASKARQPEKKQQEKASKANVKARQYKNKVSAQARRVSDDHQSSSEPEGIATFNQKKRRTVKKITNASLAVASHVKRGRSAVVPRSDRYGNTVGNEDSSEEHQAGRKRFKTSKDALSAGTTAISYPSLKPARKKPQTAKKAGGKNEVQH